MRAGKALPPIEGGGLPYGLVARALRPLLILEMERKGATPEARGGAERRRRAKLRAARAEARAAAEARWPGWPRETTRLTHGITACNGPLGQNTGPGQRGWFARVVQEGEIRVGDEIFAEAPDGPPAKKQRKTKKNQWEWRPARQRWSRPSCPTRRWKRGAQLASVCYYHHYYYY